MIRFEEARQLIRRRVRRLGRRKISLENALGSVAARDVFSPCDMPRFDNTAMDGFVLRSQDTRDARPGNPVRLRIRGVIRAGNGAKRRLLPGETRRIMTGAPIPPGGDTILPREDARVEEGWLVIPRRVPNGRHIRRRGEETRAGRRVLSKGCVIGPGTVGFLATLGKAHLEVFKKPRVSVVTTGDEITRLGRPLVRGKIYDSNSAMIRSALSEMGMPPRKSIRVPDDPRLLLRAARGALRRSDVVVFIGGVSVGDYDFTKDVLRAAGVKTLFWKVRQKPGKPIYLGRAGRKLVFGLPGNPASVFTCFYQYVYPVLRRLAGFEHPELEERHVPLRDTVRADEKRLLLLKARMNGPGRPGVRILSHQGSHMLSSLAEANSLVLVPPGRKARARGSLTEVWLLPGRNGD